MFFIDNLQIYMGNVLQRNNVIELENNYLYFK